MVQQVISYTFEYSFFPFIFFKTFFYAEHNLKFLSPPNRNNLFAVEQELVPIYCIIFSKWKYLLNNKSSQSDIWHNDALLYSTYKSLTTTTTITTTTIHGAIGKEHFTAKRHDLFLYGIHYGFDPYNNTYIHRPRPLADNNLSLFVITCLAWW